MAAVFVSAAIHPAAWANALPVVRPPPEDRSRPRAIDADTSNARRYAMTSDTSPVDALPPAEPTRRYYVRPTPHVLIAFLPALGFIAADRVAATPIAIVASFAVSAVIFVRNPGGGVIRMLGVVDRIQIIR